MTDGEVDSGQMMILFRKIMTCRNDDAEVNGNDIVRLSPRYGFDRGYVLGSSQNMPE
jgi:hypothetical protein